MGTVQRSTIPLLLGLCLLAGSTALTAQPAFQVADAGLLQDPDPEYYLFPNAVELQGAAYLPVDDGVHGWELWRVDGTVAGSSMVKDICPGVCSARIQHLTVSAGRLFFTAYDAVHGLELWTSDGTPEGTTLVKDVVPGLYYPTFRLVFPYSGGALFVAWTLDTGWTLWTSDGTAEGTVQVADPIGSSGLISPRDFWLELAGTVFFVSDDGVHGHELWKTDGTPEGTALVKDIAPGTASGFPGSFEIIGNRVLFAAEDGVHGRELWITDGTEAGTSLLVDLEPGAQGASPRSFVPLGDEVLFLAQVAPLGVGVWKTDGTAGGTAVVKHYAEVTTACAPDRLTGSGGTAFFFADDGTTGCELFKTDGTPEGTVLAADIRPGSESSIASFPKPSLHPFLGGVVLFADDGVHGAEPWFSDGTSAGTVLLADIQPGTAPQDGGDRGLAAGELFYFKASTEVQPGKYQLLLWATDGTPDGTAPLAFNHQASLFPQNGFGQFLYPKPFGNLGGILLFSVGEFEPDLWSSDGTAEGTGKVGDTPLYAGIGVGPFPFSILGDRAVFVSAGLSVTDGTEEGTFSLTRWVRDRRLARLGDRAYFVAGFDLGSTDGTLAGTVTVKTLPSAPALPPDWNLTTARDRIFFTSADPEGPDWTWKRLWVSDGTDAGTTELAPIGPDPHSFSWDRLAASGSRVFFSAFDDLHGRELWVSDGTPAGTTLVADVLPGPSSALEYTYGPALDGERSLVTVGPTAFFSAQDGVHGFELWKSDGTAAGTVLVKDVNAGTASSEVTWLTRVRQRLFFVADDGVHGRELWVSDGTPEGTRLVADLVPGPGSSVPRELIAIGNQLVFSALDPEGGVEPWATDGTLAGTRRLDDIAPGPLPSSPQGFTHVGANLYFAATDATTGFELWAIPRAELGSSFGDVPTGHWAWKFVEALADAGITRGCGPGSYCPALSVSRAEMAVFLGRALQGEAFTPPPATGTRFDDVPASFWAAAWIEQIAEDGVTQGCSATPPRYCPGASVTRAEMAIFLLRSIHGADYTPPPATGTVFSDVPASHWAAAWIERLAAEGITKGCAVGLYCPTSPVTRAEMAVFLVRAFGLTVP